MTIGEPPELKQENIPIIQPGYIAQQPTKQVSVIIIPVIWHYVEPPNIYNIYRVTLGLLNRKSSYIIGMGHDFQRFLTFGRL